MKAQLMVAALATLLAASPALAQGTFSPGRHSPSLPAQKWPPLPGQPEPPKPHTYTRPNPTPPDPKPYTTPHYPSVYGAPPSAPKGAKDCELSVYVNACGPRKR